MEIDILFRIAAIGILVTVISQILTRAGREDIATMATLSGLIVVLVMVWVVKFLFQIQIPVPQKALKPFEKNKKIDAEETALVEV